MKFQLKAKAQFAELLCVGKANTHSYSILINAHIRCGDYEGAVQVVRNDPKYNSLLTAFLQFKNMQKQNIFAGVVTKTSIVKAYCNAGLFENEMKLRLKILTGAIEKAWSIVLSMQLTDRKEEKPNIRTINTVLRGDIAVVLNN